MADKYMLGIDMGSLSARAVIVRARDGAPVGIGEHKYHHGVIEGCWKDRMIPDGVYFQDPPDYIESCYMSVRSALSDAGVDPSEIVSIGVDSTSPTLVLTASDGEPICRQQRFADEPFALALMWKSHSTMKEVSDIQEAGTLFDEPFLRYTGRNIASNLAVPKMLHLLRHAPEVYHAAERVFDLSDWIVKRLTGRDTMNDCTAMGKFFYCPDCGFPSEAFFNRLDPRMRRFAAEKLPNAKDILKSTDRAGTLTQAAAAVCGLNPGIAVAAGHVDGLAPLPSIGIHRPGSLMISIGTGVASYVLNRKLCIIDGVYGMLLNAPFEGLVTYETGLQSFGDTLAWFTDNLRPNYIKEDMDKRTVFELLNMRAQALKPLECGLIALNWWNGNRSPLLNGDLSGVILGLNLNSKPEDIYRALIEAMAFNFKWIIDIFNENGIDVDDIVAAGGIPMKNRFIMQLISDITGKRIVVPKNAQLPAIGSAIFAATACGYYPNIVEAIENMRVSECDEYLPDSGITECYQGLYHLYIELCQNMGRSENSPLHKLFRLKNKK